MHGIQLKHFLGHQRFLLIDHKCFCTVINIIFQNWSATEKFSAPFTGNAFRRKTITARYMVTVMNLIFS